MDLLSYCAPFVGAVALEVVYWYGLRDKLMNVKYQRMLRSRAGWLITLAMIFVGGFGSLILAEGALGPAKLFIMGAAFPSLLKQVASSAQLFGGSLKLGEKDRAQSRPVSDYLNPGWR